MPPQVLREVGKQEDEDEDEEEEEEEEEAIILTVLVGRAPVEIVLRWCTTLPKALLLVLLVLVPVVVGGGTRYAQAMAGLDHKATTAQQHSNTAVAACGVRRIDDNDAVGGAGFG